MKHQPFMKEAYHHWQSHNVHNAGVDDMVLLQKISVPAISENLKKRLKEKIIYTYIGPVLISVNPFQQLQIFTDKHVDMYERAINSGESGAGKTVAAKLIMNYIVKVSGGSEAVEGKYVQIQFGLGGVPEGGKISNFLLEKLCFGASEDQKENLGIVKPEYYYYLNQSGVYDIDDTDDVKDFKETMVVLDFPAHLLRIDKDLLNEKLIGRVMDSKWGGKSEKIAMKLNVNQALYTRDALSKALYNRLFDYLVEKIRMYMYIRIYICVCVFIGIYNPLILFYVINYILNKYSKIFLQEEYMAENIKWTPIDYFNNKIVCDLIEQKKPPGIMSMLDDVCATMHAVSEGADKNLLQKLQGLDSEYYIGNDQGFILFHYAGKVDYSIDNFCDKNRDVLFQDLIEMMQTSECDFIRKLFPENLKDAKKGRPTTAGGKIKTQANLLVEKLMQCTPHYIRCIKPNETKKPFDWEENRVVHQIEYLGLKENIRVRRAGFAYRREFLKFMNRYAILTPETWPQWRGDTLRGIKHLMDSVNISPDQFQLGTTKVFIKNPESLFLLEEVRERKFDKYARVIQKAFRKYYAKNQYYKQRLEASDIFLNKKERRTHSLNRNFVGDYIGLDQKPALLALIEKKERIEFAETVTKFDRRFKPMKRDLILTSRHLYLIGREKVKKGPHKGAIIEVVKRKIPLQDIQKIVLSPLQDDMFVIFVQNQYENLLESVFKTELISILKKRYQEKTKRELTVLFNTKLEYNVKKDGWRGGRQKQVEFHTGEGNNALTKIVGKCLHVYIGSGLPSDSRPNMEVSRNKPRNKHIGKSSGRPPPPSSKPPMHKPAPPSSKPPVHAMKGSSKKNMVTDGPKPIKPRKLINNNFMDSAPNGSQKTAAEIENRPPKPRNPPPPSRPQKPKPQMKPPPKPALPTCRCLYRYDPQNTDELAFEEGDIIEIIHEAKRKSLIWLAMYEVWRQTPHHIQ
eukprot:XP_014772537.1 PREDICTED: unconventional myosin-Ie-like [Octopus bimaculoides]